MEERDTSRRFGVHSTPDTGSKAAASGAHVEDGVPAL